MFNKLFKGPNRTQKIVSLILAIVAILAFAIWSVIEVLNLNSLAETFPVQNTDEDGMLQNKLLIAAMCVLGILGVGLFLCWYKSIIKEPGRTLKVLLIVASLIVLVAIVVQCIDSVSNITAEANALREDLYTRYDNAINNREQNIVFNEIAVVNNNEAENIATDVLTAIFYIGGLFPSFLILYGLIDCVWRAVYSLEKIANNTDKNRKDKTTHDEEQSIETPEINV